MIRAESRVLCVSQDLRNFWVAQLSTNVIIPRFAFRATIFRMDLKRLVTHFAYKIEPKTEGGFVARATDPTVPPLEAPTREELRQRIQQNIVNALSVEFPQIKAAADGKRLEMAFHVEHTPQGGFEIHSTDPNVPVAQASNQKDFESFFLEKFLNFAGKHIVPELAASLAAQAGTGSVKVVVNRKELLKMNAGPQGMTFGAPKALEIGKFADVKPDMVHFAGTIENCPITPENSSNWKAFALAVGILLLGPFMYFFFRFR